MILFYHASEKQAGIVAENLNKRNNLEGFVEKLFNVIIVHVFFSRFVKTFYEMKTI